MSSTREIRRRIRSAKNVSQITRAMEMVSASKMRKAQRNVLATRPYIDRMIDLMGELTGRMVGGMRKGTLLEERETVERVGVLVVTPDRGLCGSLVTNVLRRTSQFILEQREAGREVVVFAIGKKGRDYLRRTRQPIQAEIIDLPDAPRLEDILGVATDMVKSFLGDRGREGEEGWRIDEAYIIYSEFINTLVQRPALKRLMPVDPPVEPPERQVDYTYEPSQEEVLEALLPRYVEALLYQSVLESIASEHSARMVAMRNATDNAKELVRDLTLSYNKARQSNITKEVSEISTGAMYLESG
jgi:F-type H+-transporting ATPase subunit gamma